MLDIHINQQHINIPQAVLQSHNINVNDKYDVQFQGKNIVLVPVFEIFIKNSRIVGKLEKNSCSEKKSSRKLSVKEAMKEIKKLNFQTDKCLTVEEMDEGVAKGFANWKEENA